MFPYMNFDFSTETIRNVKCVNPDCSYVYKIRDRREPIVNDPGFVVMKCPRCHYDIRVKVWNVDYFNKNKRVVGVYECGEEKKCPDLSSVALGEFLEEAIGNEQPRIDLIPKISFWELMGQKEPDGMFNDKLKHKIDESLYSANQAALAGQLSMDRVDRVFVKIPRRKNSTKDYYLYAKLIQTDISFDTSVMIPIHKGNLSLTKLVDGLFTRDECFSILAFCLNRWAMMANQVIIAVPFIGFHYKSKRCKNQVLYFWSFLNSVLDMQKTLLITRKSEFNKLKDCLNEQKEDETYTFLKYWGKLNQLLDAATSAESKKKRNNEEKSKKKMDRQVFYTNNFHSKFYAGVYEDRVEVLVGSYNVHEGNVFENLFFKDYSLDEFRKKYLNKILPDVKLIKESENIVRALYCEANENRVQDSVKDLKDIVEEIR